jgi:hypothetical protein
MAKVASIKQDCKCISVTGDPSVMKEFTDGVSEADVDAVEAKISSLKNSFSRQVKPIDPKGKTEFCFVSEKMGFLVYFEIVRSSDPSENRFGYLIERKIDRIVDQHQESFIRRYYQPTEYFNQHHDSEENKTVDYVDLNTQSKGKIGVPIYQVSKHYMEYGDTIFYAANIEEELAQELRKEIYIVGHLVEYLLTKYMAPEMTQELYLFDSETGALDTTILARTGGKINVDYDELPPSPYRDSMTIVNGIPTLTLDGVRMALGTINERNGLVIKATSK